LKSTGIETKFFSRWAGYYTKTLNGIQKMAGVNLLYSIWPFLLEGLTMAALLTVGAYRVIQGHLTIGMLIALQILMRYFMTPVTSFVGLQQQIQLLKVDIARLDDVLHNHLDPVFKDSDPKPEWPDAAKLKGYVELRGITFGYNPNIEPIVKGIHLQLSPGKSVALVGPSGCGKSTIAKLIAGLFTEWEGEILFDGKPRSDYPRPFFTNSVGVIEQDPFVFSGTFRDNLTLLDPTYSEEDMIRAAKDALIHDDIIARKGAYEGYVAERGSNLSGGQRQRMEIARSLLRNPVVLVMDEATSSLDSNTELEVVKNVRRRGCACLVIAHRMSTIANCDEIIVIDKGEIVQKGTHDELKAIPGLYADMIESEQRG
jgi:ATP-binding cassette subfamily C protein